MSLVLTPTLEADIAAKEAEIAAEEVHLTREAYIAAVAPLQAERNSLIAQNEAIIAANAVLTAEYVPPLAEYKVIAQDAVKTACNMYILSVYSVEDQRNAGMDIYPFETCMTMSQFIADCIAEEDRCHDVIESAADITDVDSVTAVWPEVI